MGKSTTNGPLCLIRSTDDQRAHHPMHARLLFKGSEYMTAHLYNHVCMCVYTFFSSSCNYLCSRPLSMLRLGFYSCRIIDNTSVYMWLFIWAWIYRWGVYSCLNFAVSQTIRRLLTINTIPLSLLHCIGHTSACWEGFLTAPWSILGSPGQMAKSSIVR